MATGEDQPQHVVAQRALRLHGLDHLLHLVCDGLGSPSERRRSLVDRADSRRSMSSALRRATTVSHARGLSGIPALGHASMAAIVASERASSATVKSPNCRARVASTLGPSAFSTSTRASPEALKAGIYMAWATGAIGRSSIFPPRQTVGICAAQAIASSRSAVSSTKYPPRTSLASA